MPPATAQATTRRQVAVCRPADRRWGPLAAPVRVLVRDLRHRFFDAPWWPAHSMGAGRTSSGRDGEIGGWRLGLIGHGLRTRNPFRSHPVPHPLPPVHQAGFALDYPCLGALLSAHRRAVVGALRCAAAPACGKTPPRPRWRWRTRPASSGRAVASAARARCGAPLTVLCGSVSPPNPAPAAGRVHRGPTRPPGGCWNGSPSGSRANTGGSSATTSTPRPGHHPHRHPYPTALPTLPAHLAGRRLRPA